MVSDNPVVEWHPWWSYTAGAIATVFVEELYFLFTWSHSGFGSVAQRAGRSAGVTVSPGWRVALDWIAMAALGFAAARACRALVVRMGWARPL